MWQWFKNFNKNVAFAMGKLPCYPEFVRCHINHHRVADYERKLHFYFLQALKTCNKNFEYHKALQSKMHYHFIYAQKRETLIGTIFPSRDKAFRNFPFCMGTILKRKKIREIHGLPIFLKNYFLNCVDAFDSTFHSLHCLKPKLDFKIPEVTRVFNRNILKAHTKTALEERSLQEITKLYLKEIEIKKLAELLLSACTNFSLFHHEIIIRLPPHENVFSSILWWLSLRQVLSKDNPSNVAVIWGGTCNFYNNLYIFTDMAQESFFMKLINLLFREQEIVPEKVSVILNPEKIEPILELLHEDINLFEAIVKIYNLIQKTGPKEVEYSLLNFHLL